MNEVAEELVEEFAMEEWNGGMTDPTNVVMVTDTDEGIPVDFEEIVAGVTVESREDGKVRMDTGEYSQIYAEGYVDKVVEVVGGDIEEVFRTEDVSGVSALLGDLGDGWYVLVAPMVE